MYDVINMSVPESTPSFASLNVIDIPFEEKMDKFYTEAVFEDGKSKVEPLVAIVAELKKKLEDGIALQKNNPKEKDKAFDPKKYWKDQRWKDFENEIMKIFGFRDVRVNPYVEKYNSEKDEFESAEMNAAVYNERRFPISSLVTDKGFYDTSKTLRMEIFISLGLLRKLTPDEIIAVFLHEFGHAIDPALVDIKYTETNILSKYLTDRVGSINKDENKYMRDNKLGSKFNLFKTALIGTVKHGLFGGIFDSKDKAARKKLEKLQEVLKKDKTKFARQTFSEAYADNFARMYGFGPALMKGLQKIDHHFDDKITSRFSKEKLRQNVILSMTIDALKDVHKTDVHRCKALIKEYKEDIADENTPPKVKEQLKADLKELEAVMDMFFNNFSEFQNNVNKLIAEEIDNLDK